MADHKYYLKDKKIQLYKFTTTKVNGISVKQWEKAQPSKIWAYYRQSGGTKTLSGSAIVFSDTTENAVFIVNRQNGFTIDTSLRLVYNHKIYDIVNVDDFEGYLYDLKVTAKYSSSQTFNEGDNKGIIDE